MVMAAALVVMVVMAMMMVAVLVVGLGFLSRLILVLMDLLHAVGLITGLAARLRDAWRRDAMTMTPVTVPLCDHQSMAAARVRQHSFSPAKTDK